MSGQENNQQKAQSKQENKQKMFQAVEPLIRRQRRQIVQPAALTSNQQFFHEVSGTFLDIGTISNAS